MSIQINVHKVSNIKAENYDETAWIEITSGNDEKIIVFLDGKTAIAIEQAWKTTSGQ